MPDKENVHALIKQAKERLQAAEELNKIGLNNDSISRAYDSVFSSITLLHYINGDSYSSHQQSIGKFHKNFVHTKIFTKENGSVLSSLFEKRQTADYDAKIARTSRLLSREFPGFYRRQNLAA